MQPAKDECLIVNESSLWILECVTIIQQNVCTKISQQKNQEQHEKFNQNVI